MKQADIVRQLSSNDLKRSVLYTQLLLFTLSIILSLFLFSSMTDWINLFEFNLYDILYYGVLPAFIIILINIILDKFVPKQFLDDGGINEKLFSNQSVYSIFIIAAVVAISEELLFRGVVQTTYGYLFASLLFAAIHIRYLKKPVLLLDVLGTSFYIGYLYELTYNLSVTMTGHLIIERTVGLMSDFTRRGDEEEWRGG